MVYGAVPVARQVGGLTDSVVDAGEATLPVQNATGFTFAEDNAAGLLACLDRARDRFSSRHAWKQMQRTAMRRDYSWDNAASRYLDLYYELLPTLRQPEISRRLTEEEPA